jgi:hypothetical protein
MALNGVIHVIDKVLIPPTQRGRSGWSTAAERTAAGVPPGSPPDPGV